MRRRCSRCARRREGTATQAPASPCSTPPCSASSRTHLSPLPIAADPCSRSNMQASMQSASQKGVGERGASVKEREAGGHCGRLQLGRQSRPSTHVTWLLLAATPGTRRCASAQPSCRGGGVAWGWRFVKQHAGSCMQVSGDRRAGGGCQLHFNRVLSTAERPPPLALRACSHARA